MLIAVIIFGTVYNFLVVPIHFISKTLKNYYQVHISYYQWLWLNIKTKSYMHIIMFSDQNFHESNNL